VAGVAPAVCARGGGGGGAAAAPRRCEAATCTRVEGG
jgi:hypothetical protein